MAQASINEIATAILGISKSSSGDNLADKIASYLISERRSSDFDMIMREVSRQQIAQGVTEATITTASPVSKAVLLDVKRLLGDNNAVINQIIDKNVIGGMRLEANDFYLDLTVRSRLNKLKAGVNK